ncbi:bacterial-like globin-domain containing protein [Nitzschia inconspicua]|nr:bacterial-like globin-domain containing protein [Nitzschia inconspicua]
MSKFQLQDEAFQSSGVSFAESQQALQLSPSIYERLGEEGLLELSTLFYDRVFRDDRETWFLNIFSSSTKQQAIDNQYRFLVQTFGGPELYKEKKGKYTRLAGRHANYNIGRRAADR